MRCVTSKNWLGFGGDSGYVKVRVWVRLGLGLQLPWRRYALPERFLFKFISGNTDRTVCRHRFTDDRSIFKVRKHLNKTVQIMKIPYRQMGQTFKIGLIYLICLRR